jgi:MFS transporter, SP family, solute carrier family 2 (myo-inositol transporter), member 13
LTNSASRPNPIMYGRFLIFVAGLGGLLYGIDVGIITDALLYLDKTISLTVAQTSLIVAAVLGGGTAASLVAGLFADWLGRKKMMIVSGVLFIVSVLIIIFSHGFVVLLTGRILQGISGGVIAVVVPLYLAECLAPENRGKGSAIFQFMLTVGIVVASLTGFYFIHHADAAVQAAAGNAELIRDAQDHAWRGMFLSVIYPGILFFIGTIFLSESPRWLFRRGRMEESLAVLRRSSSEDEAQLQMREMVELAEEDKQKAKARGSSESLLQRKYVVPFVLACVILACNQTTGINSILAYLAVILRQAGMSVAQATQGDLAVKILNCVMTVVAVMLVDRRGRKFLLTIGTGGIVVSLLLASFVFYGLESKRVDVKDQVQATVAGRQVNLPVDAIEGPTSEMAHPVVLAVLYSYGDGDKVVSVLSDDKDPTLRIAPEAATPPTASLTIKRATYGSVPPQSTGWLVTACLALFIACYAAGPGVVVWLALSELMPTRIRSAGMGIALVLNQGVSSALAAVFLPVVGHYGYYAMFAFLAACTVVYFITAAFFLPETKGKSLEEIERLFDANTAPIASEGSSS